MTSTMNPDQTNHKKVPREQSDLSPYCLQYRLPKNIEEQTKKDMTGRKSVNWTPQQTYPNMGLLVRKPNFVACIQQNRRSACASLHPD